MYDWTKLTETERKDIQQYRKKAGIPWHSPPHYEVSQNTYMITAANHMHDTIIGLDMNRIVAFEKELVATITKHSEKIYAWSVLPNHYHIVIETNDLKYIVYGLGQMHGRTSRAWNLEDKTPGRKCWYRCLDKALWSEKHLYAAINYVHYNPIKHGYVDKMNDWVFSSSADFINNIGRDRALALWKQYPIEKLAKDWE